MPSDDQLEKLSYEVDDMIQKLIEKYQINPLSLTAVILARIVLTNDYVGSGQDFRELLSNIPPQPQKLQQSQVH
jgi:hypothetical protein